MSRPAVRLLLIESLRQAAAASAAALEAEAERLRARERRDIAQARAAGGGMPADYWEPRHRAERRLAAARGVLAAVLDIDAGGGDA